MVQKSLAKLVLPTLTHGLTTLTWIRVLGQLSAQVHSPHQLAQLIRASFSPEDAKNTAVDMNRAKFDFIRSWNKT